MKTYGVILAGGNGTRFWPLSRKDLPKQFLNLTGSDLMVNETIDRLGRVVQKDDIFIVTNKEQAPLALEATQGRMKENHILSEPCGRNTSACIGYAAMEIVRKYGDGIMCILPSDHYIKDEASYVEVLTKAISLAEKTDKLVTIGICPKFAATGYGYIKYGNEENVIDLSIKEKVLQYFDVEDFVEKPDTKTAKKYIEQGSYLWNSGMFIWKASVILKQMEYLLPDVYTKIKQIGDAMGTDQERETIDLIYPQIPKISIDYGIMERAENVAVLKGDFGWSDVGSWDALQNLYPTDENGNVIYGEQIHIDTHNCISYAKTKLIAALGVEDLIIVEADDAILVCHRDKAQEVGRVVEQLKNNGKEEYL